MGLMARPPRKDRKHIGVIPRTRPVCVCGPVRTLTGSEEPGRDGVDDVDDVGDVDYADDEPDYEELYDHVTAVHEFLSLFSIVSVA